MKKLRSGVLLLLAAAGVARGSVAKPSLLVASEESSEAPSLPGATAEREAPAAPAAKPRFVFGERDDYRWQLGVGVEYLRFLSSRFDSNLAGLNTTVTYFTNGWFALEGNLVTGFGSPLQDNEHVKLFAGGGGIRVGSRRARWEPWVHALVGGGHLQPQTAGASRTALMVQTGGGSTTGCMRGCRSAGKWTGCTPHSSIKTRTAFKPLPASCCISRAEQSALGPEKKISPLS